MSYGQGGKSEVPDGKKGCAGKCQKNKLYLYVEGGGNTNALRTACREGFSNFLSKAGLKGHMPRIVACGSRQDAFASYCTAIEQGERALLLVDSEAPVAAQTNSANSQSTNHMQWQPWAHLYTSDKWDQPPLAANMDCHLMVQVMESWFLADHEALEIFFGNAFNKRKLPGPTLNIEAIDKKQVYEALDKASAPCKAKYDKGEHSFKILGKIDPKKVCAASAWAQRLVETLQQE